MRCMGGVVGLFLSAVACGVSAPTQVVHVQVELDQGVASKFVCTDSEMRLATDAGRLAVPLGHIREITRMAGSDVRVASVFGDAWMGRLLSPKLSTVRRGKKVAVNLDEMPFEKIVVVGDAGERPRRVVTVRDDHGSRYVVETKDALLRVGNSAGTWDMPLGAVSRILFSPHVDGDEPEARIWLGPDRVERVNPMARGARLRVRDCFGNLLKIKLNTIREIVPEPAVKMVGSLCRDASQVELTTGEGDNAVIDLPLVVWTLRTDGGNVLLPSSRLSSVERSPDTGRFRVLTRYGEQFIGRISPERVTVSLSDDRGGDVSLDLQECRQVSFGEVDDAAPPGGFIWCLSDGSRFRADPVSADLEWSTDGEADQIVRIPLDRVATVEPSGEEYRLASQHGRLVRGRPVDDHVDLILHCNGMGYRVRWRDVLSVSRDPSDLLRSPTNHSLVTIESSVGSIALAGELIRRVETDRKANRSCLTTVFGEHFVGRALSPETLEVLLYATEGARPDAESGSLVFPHPQREVPEGWMACRLQTGDVFYMQMLEPVTLDCETGRHLRTEMTPDMIVAMSQTGGGEVVLATDRKRIEGELKTRAVDLRMLSSGETNRVNMQTVDSMEARGIDALPPPSWVVPAFNADIGGMIALSGGRFTRGRVRGEGMPDELPAQDLDLSPFLMDATEVTRALFMRFAEDTGYETAPESQDQRDSWRSPGFRQTESEPVVLVSWNDAVAFCNWRSRQAGLDPCYDIKADDVIVCHFDRNGFRLPTEAEWEYAARSCGDDVLYPWGDNASLNHAMNRANFRQDHDGALDGWVWSNPVKAFPPNASGFYGMAGNVWEWCQDWYYKRAYVVLRRLQTADPCMEAHHVSGMAQRVMRGGSFWNELDMLRCASRGSGLPLASSVRVGFRCVRSLQ